MATNEEIMTTLREMRGEMRAGFEKLNGRVRSVENRQAEYGVRLGACEARQKAPSPEGGGNASAIQLFLCIAPWLLKFLVAGAFIAFGVNAPGIVAALANLTGG